VLGSTPREKPHPFPSQQEARHGRGANEPDQRVVFRHKESAKPASDIWRSASVRFTTGRMQMSESTGRMRSRTVRPALSLGGQSRISLSVTRPTKRLVAYYREAAITVA
jgi:hypothetical protein